MREPIYKLRPVEPNPARYGGERINNFIVMSEAFSNAYLIETAEGNVQLNAGMGMEAPSIEANFKEFNQGPLHTLIFTQGHVELADGAAAILKRAQQKFTSGNNEEAIHLLDIIRDAGEETSQSRELGIKVHEALLEKTDNFWLGSWLKNQVKLLQA
jgi:hypothetical protein